MTLPALALVTHHRVVLNGFVYKASGAALKRENVAHWLVVSTGITFSVVIGFDTEGIATETRVMRNAELVKRKPLGLAPIRALRFGEGAAT